jgi:FkbM family methyltransferase
LTALSTRLAHRMMALRWRAIGALAPRRDVHPRGLRFSLQCDNPITYYRWITYETKEPETLDWIDALDPSGVLFDVGANVGLYSLYAALRHPTMRVVAFEPEFSNLHLLRDNVVANDLHERVEIYAIALSARDGLSRLAVQDLTPGAALHTESREILDRTRTGHAVVLEEGIATLTLDRFVSESGVVPTALKIDVDGTEQLILEGGVRTLAREELRSVLVEMPRDRTRSACAELLAAAGLVHRAAASESNNEIWHRRDGPAIPLAAP